MFLSFWLMVQTFITCAKNIRLEIFLSAPFKPTFPIKLVHYLQIANMSYAGILCSVFYQELYSEASDADSWFDAHVCKTIFY